MITHREGMKIENERALSKGSQVSTKRGNEERGRKRGKRRVRGEGERSNRFGRRKVERLGTGGKRDEGSQP